MSRPDVARRTQLSKPTVNEVVDELLAAAYLNESPEDGDTRPRRPGPRARLLTFNASLGHVLGIDIGAIKIVVLVADLSGNILAVNRRRTSNRARSDPEALLQEVRATARAALRSCSLSVSSLVAVGVGTPGVINPASGAVTLAPQLGGWEGIHLGSLLSPSFPCPVLVENEVRLSVLAERWRGAAKGVENALYIQIGVGIGAGILIDGEIYRGATGAAGEIGYLPLVEGNEQDGNGFGPYEYAAGGVAFARLGQRIASTPRGAFLRMLAGRDPEGVDAEVVFEAARHGDVAAVEIVNTLVERIARGIASAVVILNPEVVIVGGGVSRAGMTLMTPLERCVRDLVPLPVRLVLSTLGEESVALGAVHHALQSTEDRLFAFETDDGQSKASAL